MPLRTGGAHEATHDLDAMAAAITDRTRVILVCTPNNPTSTIVTAAEFEAFMAKVPDTVLVLLDEAYREFVTDPAAVDGIPLLTTYPNLVVLRTFSKAYGLAGLRVGYAVGPAYILDAARATAVPLSVTEPAQRAALAALDNEAELLERVAVLVERRAAVVQGLAERRLDRRARHPRGAGQLRLAAHRRAARPPPRRSSRPAGSSRGCSRPTASGSRSARRSLWKHSYAPPLRLSRPSERRPKTPG